LEGKNTFQSVIKCTHNDTVCAFIFFIQEFSEWRNGITLYISEIFASPSI